MNSIERKLLIIENKHLTSAYQMEPAHKPSHFPSHGGALPNFILSHLSLCINKSQWSSYLMENKENLAMLLQTILCQFKSGQFYLYSPESHICLSRLYNLYGVRHPPSGDPWFLWGKTTPKIPFNRERNARNHSYILFVLVTILPSGHQHAARIQNMAQLAINQLPSLQPAIFASWV